MSNEKVKDEQRKPKMKFKIINAEAQELMRINKPAAIESFKRKPYFMKNN